MDQQGHEYYLEEVRRMTTEGKRSLLVDYADLLRYDPELAEELVSRPDEVLHDAEEALWEALRVEDPDFAEKAGTIHVRVINSYQRTLLPMRQIRAEHIARLVSIDGIVTRATDIKPLLTQAWFRCLAEACGHEFARRQEEGRYNPPVTCPNPECNRKGPFKLLVERSTFVDWQQITLQEKPEDLPPGQMPQGFSSVLRDDLVDVVRPGDRVLVTGVLRSHPERLLKRGQLATYTRVLEGVACEKETEQYEKVEILPEDEKRILELAKDPVIVRKIVQSIAPSIHGYEVVKEAIACLMFGGVGKETPDGMRIRGDVNILLVGDPGVGKSQILKNISKLAPRGLYTSGRGSSAAGLTAAVLRDPESGEMSLEAGALVLADEGIAAIDELDKMRSEDRSAIHEALEQHTVSIAKAGIVATLNARAAVLAAANPREGRWDPWKEPAYNINLPPTLLSRFDLIFPLTDQPDEVEDERKSEHILKLHQSSSLETDPPLSTELLKKYIAYARQRPPPVLSSDAMARLKQFYLELRKRAVVTEKGTEPIPIPITPRQLEALIRLSEARARMVLREEVLPEDAVAAIRLLTATMEALAVDLETGAWDSDRATTGISTRARGKQGRLRVIIDKLAAEYGMFSLQQILQQAEKEVPDLDESEVIDFVEFLKREGKLYEPQSEQYRKAR